MLDIGTYTLLKLKLEKRVWKKKIISEIISEILMKHFFYNRAVFSVNRTIYINELLLKTDLLLKFLYKKRKNL